MFVKKKEDKMNEPDLLMSFAWGFLIMAWLGELLVGWMLLNFYFLKSD